MFLAPVDQTLLPLAVIDVSQYHSHRSTRTVHPRATVSRKPSIAKRFVANIVRLVPGRTRLQFGLGTR